MLSRLAGYSTPWSTAAKPSNSTANATGSTALQSRRPSVSCGRSVSLAATVNSRSDTRRAPSAEFIERYGGNHDDAEEHRLKPRVDVQEVERVAEDGQDRKSVV